MKCENAQPWVQKRAGLWVARDSDGYVLRVAYQKGGWHWSLRPPGGGYDVYAGTETDVEKAKEMAERSLRGLMAELLRGRASPARGEGLG
jgi:hypothetical protein